MTPGAASHGWFGVPGWLPPFVLAVLVVTAAAVAFRRSGIRIRVEHGPARMARGRGDDAS